MHRIKATDIAVEINLSEEQRYLIELLLGEALTSLVPFNSYTNGCKEINPPLGWHGDNKQ